MKRQISPGAAALVIFLAASLAIGVMAYKLLHRPKGGAAMKAGGGPMGGLLPPTGLPNLLVETLAGVQEPGCRDGQGKQARFDGPAGIALAPDGSLVVADSRNHRLRRVTPDGVVTTIAGSTPPGALTGGFADGPAAQAQLCGPTRVTVAPDGSVYFCDTGNHRVRRLQDGVVSTVAGRETPLGPDGIGEGGAAGEGSVPASQATFRFPTGIALAPDGTIWVCDTANGCLRRLAEGQVTTIRPAGVALKEPCDVAIRGGRLYVADAAAGIVVRLPLAPGSPPEAPPGAWPQPSGGIVYRAPAGVAAVSGGLLLIADQGSHCLFRAEAGGAVQLLAGVLFPVGAPKYVDGTGDECAFAVPAGIAAASESLFYIADFGNNCLRKATLGPPPPARRHWRPGEDR